MVITCTSVSDCTNLHSKQEKTDTRLILHAITAAEAGADVIVVCSPDTDVLGLLLHQCSSIKAEEIYFMTGRQGKYAKLTWFIPIHIIFNSLTRVQRGLLLPVYGLAGCDTVSDFFGHGKKKALKIMMNGRDKFKPMANLGDTLPMDRGQQAAATHFVCCLYGDGKCESRMNSDVKRLTRELLPRISHQEKTGLYFIC